MPPSWYDPKETPSECHIQQINGKFWLITKVSKWNALFGECNFNEAVTQVALTEADLRAYGLVEMPD